MSQFQFDPDELKMPQLPEAPNYTPITKEEFREIFRMGEEHRRCYGVTVSEEKMDGIYARYEKIKRLVG